MEKHLGVLQHALATIEVLQHPDASKMDTLLGIEKALMQMLAEKANFSSLKLRIVQLIRERKKRLLSTLKLSFP